MNLNNIKHLYIHVPFCDNICFYCDFCRVKYKEDKVNKWLDTLEKEIKDKCFIQYETIYIGGGTPSSLDLDELKRLLELIKPYTNNVLEYTIEINPESIDEEKIKLLKEYNINRISMGIQSSDDKLLKDIGRRHNFNDCINVISLLRKYNLNNISVDLMYSLPSQTIEILNKTIDDILALKVPHISIYSLTIEDNSIFKKRNIDKLDDDTEADMYELIINKLTNNNYLQYEVSNFALENHESKHNMSYWIYEDFLGISLGASSKINNQRYTNTTSFEKYFIDYNAKEEIIDLNKEDLIFENIMMSLRMNKGINIKEFNERYDIDLLDRYKDVIEKNDNLIVEEGYLRCKSLGILNNTLLDFME